MAALKSSLVLLAVSALLGGCTAMSEQACQSADWRTVGFEDGTQGRPVGTIGNYRQSCGKHGIAPDLDAYRAGHEAGVAEYCKPSRGFEVGHSGAVYQGVCPAPTEPDFVAAYNTGRHLYELESAVRQIDAQIAGSQREQQDIRGELTSIAATMVAADTTAEQRVLLVGRTAELGRRYGELTGVIDQLTRDRVGHERDLRAYQQTLAQAF